MAIVTNIKFYDNEFIFQLLLYYKNKTAISTSDLNQQISNEIFIIQTNFEFSYENPIIEKYLYHECIKKKNINLNIIKFIIEYGINVKYKEYASPLYFTCKNGNKKVVKCFVNPRTDINGETLLFKACLNGHEEIVKYLVKHGANVNKENKSGETPLFKAIFNSYFKENQSIIKYLVEHGADINKQDREGRTPLSMTCKKVHESMVKYLVEHGADINKEDNYGNPPLFYAWKYNNEEIVEYLVEHGAIKKDFPNRERSKFNNPYDYD